MRDDITLNQFAQALTAPLLEPEVSGDQIGRNRMSVVRHLSEILDNANVQVWLIEPFGDKVESRLAYWYPRPKENEITDFRGHVATDHYEAFVHDAPKPQPPPELWRSAQSLFADRKRISSPKKIFHLPIHNPIPKNNKNNLGSTKLLPLAWIFAHHDHDFNEAQVASARALGFNLAILLEHGRAHRIMEATNKCTEILHHANDLRGGLEECASVLVNSCAAEGGGAIEFVNGHVKSIHYAQGIKLTELQRAEIKRFVESSVKPEPMITELLTIKANGRETHQNPVFGNLLLIPICSSGLYLDESRFASISAADEIGFECEFPSHVLFLTRKRSPEYLGVNFSSTDKFLCQSIARVLAGSAFPKFFEQLFLRQAEYFADSSLVDEIDANRALKQIQIMLPGALSLHAASVYRNTAGQFEIEQLTNTEGEIPPTVTELLLGRATDVYTAIVRSRSEDTQHSEGIEYACHVVTSDVPVLIFQMTTRDVPLRFYILKFGSRLVEKFRVQLLKHFMRELFHFHRVKDHSDERASLLAQIRHAVVDPLAAATNAINAFQRQLQYFGRTDEAWLKLRSNKRVRELIPQALYLNNLALLFIDTGRFLFSELTYAQIRFDQYRPADLLQEVRLAFEYGLRERAQTWVVKIVGDSNRSAVGDKLLLWIAIANLIDNAIKYGHRNTPVTATLQFDPDSWSFTIENIGNYLDQTQADDLFQPFKRGRMSDPNFTRRHGTGLGLAVTQMILRAHHDKSKLLFTSAQGAAGKATTRFTFTLPYRLARES